MAPAGTAWQRASSPGAKTAVLLVFLALATAAVGKLNSSSLQGADFPDFYCAARMLLEGHGNQLYDSTSQYRCQAQYAGRVGTLYIHPPFETVLYASVAWLPLKDAYLLWTFLNLLLLAVASRALTRAVLPGWNWQLLPVLALTFVPLLLCLIQGQDSIVLLLLMTLAYVNLRRDRDFFAGCWLALGLFKFQLVLPLFLVLLLARSNISRRALAFGFALVTIALLGFSAAISGGSVLQAYPRFLAHLPEQHFAGLIPSAMPNFRGLAFLFFHRDRSPAAIAVVIVLSVIGLVAACRGWRRVRARSNPSSTQACERFDLAFSASIIFSLLVSYHLNPHDLTLALLPIFLLLHHRFSGLFTLSQRKNSRMRSTPAADWALLTVIVLLFLPPIHLLALAKHIYALIALLLLLLFFLTSRMLQQRKNEKFI